MKADQSSTLPAASRSITGTIRDLYERPMPKATVRAFQKGLRDLQQLAETTTDINGVYTLSFVPKTVKGVALVVQVFDNNKKLLASRDVDQTSRDVPADQPSPLTVDISLAGRPYPGPSELDGLMENVSVAAGAVSLSEITDTAGNPEIGFLVQQSGEPQGLVEKLILAARYATYSSLPIDIWYGILRVLNTDRDAMANAGAVDFETRLASTYDRLMHLPADQLVAAVRQAIDVNFIAYLLTAELDTLAANLTQVAWNYAQKHPVTGQPSALLQTGQIGGLTGVGLQTFVTGQINRVAMAPVATGGTAAAVTPGAAASAAAAPATPPAAAVPATPVVPDAVVATQQVAALVGNDMNLTALLVKNYSIQSPSDVKKLAALTGADWDTLLKQAAATPKPVIPAVPTAGGKGPGGKAPASVPEGAAPTGGVPVGAVPTGAAPTPSVGAGGPSSRTGSQLEKVFMNKFPTAAFAARLGKDATSKVPMKDKVAQVLQHDDFDLAKTRVGQFLAGNKGLVADAKAPADADAQALADGLRRVQRVFKLSPNYDHVNHLLSNDIHSAHQIVKMGKEPFVAQFGNALGTDTAETVFAKAATVHASTVALVGNLKSMTDASTLNVFPDFAQTIQSTLVTEVPDLDTLFGHADFCECDECTSVYGAPAYLTDILHFLENRNSSLGLTTKPNHLFASVKDLLLRRRPDLGDIDLNCDNSNTEVPYIDIACEIMEDYIAPPVVTIASGQLPNLKPGPMETALYTAITTQFNSTGQSYISAKLPAGAMISDSYSPGRLQADNTFVVRNSWTIRSEQLTLKATDMGAAGIEIRVLHQTLQDPGAIGAAPEYVNVNAYNTLRTANHPFSLPFDLFGTEAELFLEKAGTSRAELIDVFRAPEAPANGPTATDQLVASTALGISEPEQALIFQSDLVNQSTYWGFNVPTDTQFDVSLAMLEKATGLDFDQIAGLYDLPFGGLDNTRPITRDGNTCDLSKIHISVFVTDLDFFRRLIRLWRKTDLTLYQVDNILTTRFAIDNASPYDIRQYLVLRDSLGLSMDETTALFGSLTPTLSGEGVTFYNSLFQNPVLTNPVNPDFSVDSVGGFNGTPPLLTDTHKALIAAVLQMTVAEVNVLTTKMPRLMMGPLSVCYQHATLARALRITVTDLLAVKKLIDVPPFQNAATTVKFVSKYKTLAFSGWSIAELNYLLLDQDDSARPLIPSDTQVAAALSGLQNDLLAVRAATQPAPDPAGSLLGQWLSDASLQWDPSLATRLLGILSVTDDAEYQAKVDANTNFLLNLRIQYPASVTAVNLAALPVAGDPAAPIALPVNLAGQLSYDAGRKQLVLRGVLSQADVTALHALSGDPGWSKAVDTLPAGATTTPVGENNVLFAAATDVANLSNITADRIADRYALFLNAIAPVYRRVRQTAVLVDSISTWFTIDATVASQLLSAQPAISQELTDDVFVNRQSTDNNKTQAARYRVLAKICFAINKLNPGPVLLNLLLTQPGTYGLPDLFHLAPVTGGDATLTGFAAWEKLIDLLRVESLYPAVAGTVPGVGGLSLYDVLSGAVKDAGQDLTAFRNDLAGKLPLLTGWKIPDLGALLALVFPTADAVKNIAAGLQRLYRCVTILQQLNASLADVTGWCKGTLTADDALLIKNRIKTKFNRSDWQSLSTTLENTLREKKRDALIAWLLANPGTNGWQDSDDLFDYFLLDVEMCSCRPTSRIVEATNAVQLFVQRCHLGLEPFVTVDAKADSAWLQWDWMKYFRLWQANMKIFLYPENYIEPELLPSTIKSPFLQELENDLLQNEVTADSVETAFENYLHKLDGVARLEIKGMWYDDFNSTLHVVGRTYGGDSRIYYYRTFDGRRWTPWSKIDLEINSDHILPVVYNNRVYLFWALFTENPVPPTTVAVPPAPGASASSFTIQQPDKSWSIQMAFSELKSGKWSPKKVSNPDASGTLTVSQSTRPDKTLFMFTPLDLPLYDYANIFKDGKPVDDMNTFQQKAAQAVLVSNGSIVINCYYFALDNSMPAWVGTFEMDLVKGYPVINRAEYAYILNIGTDRFINMLATSPAAIQQEHQFNVFVPNLKKTQSRNLIPVQMGMYERWQYLAVVYNMGTLTPATAPILASSTSLPLFFQDGTRTYYVEQTVSNDGDIIFSYPDISHLVTILATQGVDAYLAALTDISSKVNAFEMFRYFNFYHSLVPFFVKQLFTGGVAGLMARDTQLKGDFANDPHPDPAAISFEQYFSPGQEIYSGSKVPVTYPNGKVDAHPGYPKDDVDFNLQAGYGLYNWELFFHAPLMIAERLSMNQQFDDADRWYRYIFNPMDTSNLPIPDKYWNTKPFFLNVDNKYVNQRIENILTGVDSATPTNDPNGLLKDVSDWRKNPFEPHLIAEYRTVAYQKVAVMKYIGHLIRYGDYLFSQSTMESVNEATQLYILASEILGPKPQLVPSAVQPGNMNYNQLEQKLDALSNALVDIENLVPGEAIDAPDGSPDVPTLQTLYFRIPANQQLIGSTGFWDVVADRLFKIRHCLNIDGQAAPLSLFAPPIDPGMLVRAAAAGISLGSVLADLNGPLPLYRFQVMIQKVIELVNEVKSLGSALSLALEKKDAETAILLRSTHEIKLNTAVLAVKQKQVSDAQSTIDNLNKQKELVTVRQQYYSGLINTGLNANEHGAIDLSSGSINLETIIAEGTLLAGALSLIPNVHIGASGFGGSPHAVLEAGGDKLSRAGDLAVGAINAASRIMDKTASLMATKSGYDRRAAEWKFQLDLAGKELEQLDVQLAGAQIRLDIAGQDLANQQLQIDQAKEYDALMHSKFTNEDLFTWVSNQLSTVYFRSYQLAYDVAKRAERGFRYELGLENSSYINFGYWDSLKKGLLAGEQLGYDLRRMETDYLSMNVRELELSKPVSLSQLDPVALMKLKTTGDCWFNLPEELFDMDYPGHYMRRVKSVAVTIPCIVGPYTTISCTLTMTKHSVRTSPLANGGANAYARALNNGIPSDDTRFRDSNGALQSIATSTGQNDSGLFELNFRDDRYLPFEGAGAISLWHLQLPAAVRQIDYNTISDVIIHLKYTARDGGEALRLAAGGSLNTRINQMLVSTKDTGLMRLFSAKNDLPNEWYRFLHPVSDADDQVLNLMLDGSRFPLFVQGKRIQITSVEVAADTTVTTGSLQVVAPASAAPDTLNLAGDQVYGTWLRGSVDYSAAPKDPGAWVIKNPAASPRLTDAQWNNLVIIIRYTVS